MNKKLILKKILIGMFCKLKNSLSYIEILQNFLVAYIEWNWKVKTKLIGNQSFYKKGPRRS